MKRYFGAPSGSAHVSTTFMRPVSWGPHEVGGAEPRAERR